MLEPTNMDIVGKHKMYNDTSHQQSGTVGGISQVGKHNSNN